MQAAPASWAATGSPTRRRAADAAAGVFTSFTQASNYLMGEYRYTNFEMYIQDTWKGFIYNGIGIWAGVALLSIVHAGSQVSSGISVDFQDQNFYVTLEENRVDFNFRY